MLEEPEPLTKILILPSKYFSASVGTTKQYEPRFEKASDTPEIQIVYLSNANLKCYQASSLVSDVHYDLLTFRFHSPMKQCY
jgi:hypothetical protein